LRGDRAEFLELNCAWAREGEGGGYELGLGGKEEYEAACAAGVGCWDVEIEDGRYCRSYLAVEGGSHGGVRGGGRYRHNQMWELKVCWELGWASARR